jgi:hypothetical protein
MEKRYQVFVSSTYTDLMEERNEAMQAILELDCMPAGMELFPAANDAHESGDGSLTHYYLAADGVKECIGYYN